MKEERYSIIFSSKTGNTAELANAIRDALPQENCDYCNRVGSSPIFRIIKLKRVKP